MPRVVVILIGLVAVLLVAAQLALPAIAERRAEDRFEERGGTAKVDVGAFPAVRLLFGDGGRFTARGSGLSFDISRERGDLGKLDGFDEVDIRLTRLDAGPVEVADFELRRPEGAAAYELRMVGTTTPREIAGFLGSEAGGALGGLFGGLAAGSLPGGGAQPVPLEVAASVESRDGRPEARAVEGTVAGAPAGPIADLVVAAVLSRL